jgi:predicted DNA-binding ribbon-helix-helix protein
LRVLWTKLSAPFSARSRLSGQDIACLEDAFWNGLKEIASDRDMATSELVAAINSERQHGNLSSAIRLFVLGFYHDQISEHEKHDRKREMLANATVPTATPSPVT